MSNEISYKNISRLISEIKAGNAAAVYLVHGDEFLCKSAFKSILEAIVPPRHQGLNYEAFDGANENVREVIQHLNTFPLIPSSKVVALLGARVFYSDVATEKMEMPAGQDDAELLNNAILDGFPESNHLLLTADLVDKRRKLYKTIKETGVVIDCSVPKGDRTADRRQQEEQFRAHMRQALEKAGKTMAPGAFEALYEKVGPGMRGFANELDKLIDFARDRKQILPSDVDEVSKRTRQDPLYEMTSAVAARDLGGALFFLGSLLGNKVHPLQVLSAVASQVRKLILGKDFIQSGCANTWSPDLDYVGFQKMILPELEKREPDILTSKAHPYSIYMTFRQSGNYTLKELINALEILLEADMRLKGSAQDPKLVLEYALLGICGRPGDVRRRVKGFQRP